MKDRKKYIGRRFGRLLVIKYAFTRKSNNYWKCRCTCGVEVDVPIGSLVSGHTKSCGCYKLEESRSRRGTQRYSYKHGDCKKHLYNVWQKMRNRCNNQDAHNYKWYGGRGISVCKEWMTYTNFKKWSINNGYNEKLEIDRIDNDGNYDPSNCRWTTHTINMRNISSNRRYSFEGGQYLLSELEDKCGVRVDTLRMRINKLHWSIEEAVNTPTKKGHIHLLHGERHTLIEWARKYKVNADTVRYRVVVAKWDLEKALTTSAKRSYFYNDKYYTLTELANKYGIKRSALESRIIVRNWSLEKALNTPVSKNRGIGGFIHEGKKWTLAELAKKYNIDVNTLSTRIYRSKWSLEKALTTPIKEHKK